MIDSTAPRDFYAWIYIGLANFLNQGESLVMSKTRTPALSIKPSLHLTYSTSISQNQKFFLQLPDFNTMYTFGPACFEKLDNSQEVEMPKISNRLDFKQFRFCWIFYHILTILSYFFVLTFDILSHFPLFVLFY